MKPVDLPQADIPLVDSRGMLTIEGHQMLLRMAEALREAQTTINDHETRITALEP